MTDEPDFTGLAATLDRVAMTRSAYTLDEHGAKTAIADITACHELMTQAADAIRTLATPNLFWPEGEDEGCEDPESYHRFVGYDAEVIAFRTARVGLPPIFSATVVHKTADSKPVVCEFQRYATREEAEKAYADSLAAAREAAGLDPEGAS
ncbi:MAG: hypothetical protein P1U37_06740 [Minwuia sp.]|nr:hypothetical protein [Minwuia sp.]